MSFRGLIQIITIALVLTTVGCKAGGGGGLGGGGASPTTAPINPAPPAPPVLPKIRHDAHVEGQGAQPVSGGFFEMIKAAIGGNFNRQTATGTNFKVRGGLNVGN